MTRAYLGGALILVLALGALLNSNTIAQDSEVLIGEQRQLGADLVLEPPVAVKIPTADTTLGDIRIDDYFWLRDKEDPDVIDYLYAENDYTEAVMKPTEALQESLYQELIGRIQENDLSVPVRIDEYMYYNREEEGKDYKIYCRKFASFENGEEILLDLNEIAAGKEYLLLGTYEVSPDHRYLAYGIDTTGAENFTLYIKDLETGAYLSDTLGNIGSEVAWAADNKTLFYTLLDPELDLPYKVMRHTLGSNNSTDELVYEEKDDAFFLSLSKSRSERFIFIQLGNYSTSEWRYLPANKPAGDFRVINARERGIEYYVTHRADKFLILTNENAPNFKLVGAPVANPGKSNWRELIPHRENVTIESMLPFENFLVMFQREGARQHIVVQDDVNGVEYSIDMPEEAYSIEFSEGYVLANNPEYRTNMLRFLYESMVTPKSVYDYDMENWMRHLKKRYQVGGGFEKTNYESERIFATAPDGEQVPISLVYHKDKFKKDGTNPLYLYGYGAYGISYDPYFSTNRISLLDRGFVFAIAHVRGGGVKGRGWYESGKLLSKKNSFTDFIACAEELAEEQYCDPEKMFASGGSAGGLLVGTVLNLRPTMFRGVVLDVPFVDVLNTMLDATIPLTVPEYDEWGNPAETREYYDYIKSYAPYENVVTREYTNILITAGLNDPRVPYWEPAKLAAKLRASRIDNNLLMLKTEMGSGHYGSSGRYQRYREIAFEFAFILKVLNLKS